MTEALKKADDLYRKSLYAVGTDLQTIRDGFKKDARRYIINIGQARELDHKYYQADKYRRRRTRYAHSHFGVPRSGGFQE